MAQKVTNQELSYSEIISRITTLATKKLSAEQAQMVTAFVQQYYSNVSVEDLNVRLIEDLYGAMLSHWNLIYQRKPGECKIRIYNPSFEQNGWESAHTIIEVTMDDMPFLVDSLRMEIFREGFSIHFMIHLGGMKLRRDADGHVLEVLPMDSSDKSIRAEAPIYIEIDRQTDPEVLSTLQENLYRVLNDVRSTVEDWPKMRAHMQQALEDLANYPSCLDPDDVAESKFFLSWLLEDHFTFLGCRDYRLVGKGDDVALEVIPGTGMGVLRNESKTTGRRKLSSLPPEAIELAMSQQVLVISKTNTKATVHRPVYTDYIGVKRFDKDGTPCAEQRFIGLFTSTVYNTHPKDIPFIRRKVALVMQNSKLSPTGHGGKELLDILTTLPRDDLFQATTQELTDLGIAILHIQQRPRIRLFVRRDAYNRFVSCLVYVPREQFNTDLRETMQNILLREFNGTEITFSPLFSESVLARVHYQIRTDPKVPLEYDVKAIEAKLIEAGRTWQDDLRDNLIEYYGEEKGTEYANKYAKAFPASYREDFSVRTAVYDIDHMEKLSLEHPLEMTFYRTLDEVDGRGGKLRLKLFQSNNPIALSDVLPMLENMGLRVIEERPHEVTCKGNHIWINDFGLVYVQEGQLDVEIVSSIFQEAFARIWMGEVENDGFNRLVLGAQLSWRETVILRAYTKYLRQIGFTFSQAYIEAALAKNTEIVKQLVELFKLRFDPTLQASSSKECAALEQKIATNLDAVANLDEDRILRRLLEVIRASVRTNYFQHDEQNRPKFHLSFKLNPAEITDLPLPRPLYEVFVYSPRVEAIHLRAAKVARGGIRWSDRREDFRTEVLGLMKAQQVKNAVIVPYGAKGGFVVKNFPAEATRDAIMNEVIACYQTFMRGLLDITDNIKQGAVIPPNDTVRYDDDDPYLVVAADKGTASFSDIANSISAEYDFWLGDAFASGGSAGYDHKKMAITARGAWESVKRHFRTLGINPDQQDFTVIGIGDMSGDVFGNGMLRSRHIQLLAAFNHMHIFLDPNPDAEKSFAERERLFNLPRSGWDDYDQSILSAGGGVFRRSLKAIPLSAEVKQRFGFTVDTMEPNQLIRALLQAEVDLLWNGGIGTYVKAKTESHMDAGDRSNDAVRVNGEDLRCRVVGEGGNLGFTQLGRIEYALKGGLNYTDFIDNSAGVDCSDHEVNSKILLNGIVASGDMTLKQRNELLFAMTSEVADLVLQDNYCQTRAINLATSQAVIDFQLYKQYLDDLVRDGKIDRELERLPDEKTLLERKASGVSFTRPEIAVLLSYTKMLIKADLLASDVPEDAYLSQALVTAFPKPLREKYHTAMEHHSLRREIIATQLSNYMVNDMGITFTYRMQNETNASVDSILRGYAIAREIFGLEQLIALLENLDYSVPAEVCYQMMAKVVRLVRRSARWFLRGQPGYLQDVSATVKTFQDGIADLNGILSDLLVGNIREQWQSTIQELQQLGVAPAIAIRISDVAVQYTLLDIIDAANTHGFRVKDVATVYFALGNQLELDWLRERITNQAATSYWELLARASLRDDLDIQQRNLTIAVLQGASQAPATQASIDTWAERHEAFLPRWQQLLTELRNAPNLEFIMFSVAARQLAELVQASIAALNGKKGSEKGDI